MRDRRARNRERRALAFAQKTPATRGYEITHRGGMLSSTWLARFFPWGGQGR